MNRILDIYKFAISVCTFLLGASASCATPIHPFLGEAWTCMCMPIYRLDDLTLIYDLSSKHVSEHRSLYFEKIVVRLGFPCDLVKILA